MSCGDLYMRFPKKMPIQLSSNFLLATNFFLGEKNISQYGLGLQGSEEYLQCLHSNKVIIKCTNSCAKQLVPIIFSTAEIVSTSPLHRQSSESFVAACIRSRHSANTCLQLDLFSI